jgi:hypothetical protein
MKRTRIADWAGADGVVREQAFADCEIIGPVQLVPVGVDNRVLGCEFPFAPDNYAQARGGGGPVLLLVGCTFRCCGFALDVDASQLAPLNQ